LKPENVLFTKSNDAKVTDWGLARVLFGARSRSDARWKGTLTYSAPEQFDPDTYGDPNFRTDIYQLVVLLYEMATGKLPFKGRAPEKVMYNILNMEPEPPRVWMPELPEKFDEAIMKALKKKMEDRCTFAGYF